MEITGQLLKMRTEYANPVKYFIPVGQHEVYANELLGTKLSLEFTGTINCIKCGAKTAKSFNQGFCYNCFKTAPENDPSVINPELSKSQFGIARDMEWAEKHDLIGHYVYLSLTSNLKVGVTRHTQIPTRWIDQGASAAIKLAYTPNRHIAGIIESFLKKHVADKTNWRSMLQDHVETGIDLIREKERLIALLHPELQKYAELDNDITQVKYPGEFIPSKIASLSFDKQSIISGKLMRIKGQYLIFENNNVLNIRKHAGYSIMFRAE
ncbi:MAG: DUF2797 domain-containing protein [Prolixibacteraceae bacterium]|nr:DUF2797 domain-containing protein [Prolixibacteraceae bacterium]MBN2649620.1 DUF2797 domain-containing protein [Prolixibacteraceae bacterium]